MEIQLMFLHFMEVRKSIEYIIFLQILFDLEFANKVQICK